LHYASPAVGTLTAEIVVAIPVFGCEPLANAPAVVGKLVLVERGTCDFVDKAANAVAAGAVAVVIINVSTPSAPISLARVRGRANGAYVAYGPVHACHATNKLCMLSNIHPSSPSAAS
jgi:hypothetical protein